VNDSWTYNGFGEPASYTVRCGASELYAVSFTRDNAGRIVTKTETIGGVVSTYNYTYDPARGWLTDVISNGVHVVHYQYDDNGNRLVRATPTQTVTCGYDDQDRLLSLQPSGLVLPTTFTYTANGELLTKTTGSDTTTYSYDVRGCLREVVLPDGTRVEYVIDPVGRRIGRKVNGVFTHKWLYQDMLRPIAELDAAGNVLSRFVYAGKANVPEYMVKDGVTYRLITDHLGSVRLVVNVSDGSIAQRLDYDEFGRVLADPNPGFQPFGFAGGLYHPLTGLIRFGARDYDADTGRWTSKDPIGFGGGDANLYGYAGGDPINIKDSDGQNLPVVLTIAGAGLVITAISEAVERYYEAEHQALLGKIHLERMQNVEGFMKGLAPNPGDAYRARGEAAVRSTSAYIEAIQDVPGISANVPTPDICPPPVSKRPLVTAPKHDPEEMIKASGILLDLSIRAVDAQTSK